MFTVSKGNQVFFGGNDDYINPDSYYWVDPGNGKDYGAIWIGTPDNVQQGVNEKGLAYDANGLPRVDVNPHRERIPVIGDYTSYPIRILHECATVAEAIAWVNSHRWHSYMHDQMQFADATGDAVIISAGADGEVALTRKSPGDGYLVSTNFNVAEPTNGYGYPCWRYDTATKRLARLLSRERALSIQDTVDVLDAIHVERGGGWRSALVEATGDVAPTVVAFTAAALAILLSPAAKASQPLQLMLFCGLPVLAGLLAFQGPLLASATRQRYFRILIERAPHAWAAANLGIAGILAPGIALANLSVQMPLPPWIAVVWWASAVAGALPAMLLLLPYEAWAVRRGLRAWSALASGEGEVVTVPCRKLWWWILLSWAVLIGGMNVQRLLLQVLGP